MKQKTYTEEDVRARILAHFKEQPEEWERELNIAYMAASNVSSGPSEALIKNVMRFLKDAPTQIAIGRMYGLDGPDPQADVYFDLGGLSCRLLFTIDEDDGSSSIISNTGTTEARKRARNRYELYKSQQ